MYIESLHISCFGSLRDYSLELCPDINVLEGDNEAGKSTVAEFIRFMLYGFEDKADREKYQNFLTATASGSMIVRDGDKKWRIERRCSGARDSVNVFDTEDGSKCFAGKVPGETFFGIPASLFRSTAFVGQTGGGKIDGKSTSEAVENLLFSADENVDLKKALKKLNSARTELMYKNRKGGRIYDNNERISRLSAELSAASETNAEIITLKSTNAALAEANEKDRNLLKTESANARNFELLEARNRNKHIKDLEEKYRQAEAAHAAYVEANTRCGFFPDAKYFTLIRESENEIVSADRRINEINSRLDAMNGEMERDRAEQKRIAEEEENEKAVIAKKRNTALGVSVLCCVMCLLSASASAVLFLRRETVISACIGALAAALLIGLIIALAYVTRYNHTLKNYTKIISTKEDVYREKLGMVRDELEAALSEKAKKKAELDAVCRRWGAVESPRLAQEIKDVLETERRLADEEENCRISYVSAKTVAETSSTREPEDDGREIVIPEGFNYKETIRREQFLAKATEARTEKLHENVVRLTGLTSTTREPTEILAAIDEIKEENAELAKQYEAYETAYEMLVSAGERMRASVSPKLSESSGKLMESVTDGKYSEIGVDSGFSVTFRPETENGERQTREDIFMSTGTSDAAYICLRLSLAKLVSNDKNPPVVFDESFVHLDNTRLLNMLKILDAGKSQVLILTSTDREATALASIEGITFNRIFI